MQKNLVSGGSGPIKNFRFFSGGVALVFMLLLLIQDPLQSLDPINRRSMLAFCITYGAIFAYLMIPGLRKHLRRLYLPSALLAASIIPIAIINSKYRHLMEAGISFNHATETMTVTILLLFPLIITAWQYKFPIVFLFYVVLGALDPLLIILVNGSFTLEISEAFIASLIRILALCAVGFVITELRNMQRTEQKALEEANRKLEEYAKSSERLAVSRERNRLARDLHDTLAHTLSGLAIQLGAMDTVVTMEPNNLKPMIEKAHVTVCNGLNETRRALKALRASPLDDLGLPLALEHLANDAMARGGITICTELPTVSPKWDKALEEVAYRISQEALENIVRHAQATEASMKLLGDPSFLRLEIEDTGCGFHKKTVSIDGRFGIQGMEERAHSIGGRIKVESIPSEGTRVVFEWMAPKS